MHKRFWLSIAMAAIGASMLAATGLASSGKAGHAAVKSGGVIKGTLQTDFEHIDPALAYDTLTWQVEYQTQRMLVSYTHSSGKAAYRLYNDAAKNYTVSKDGKTYTFHLRHGIKFSDGKPVTAANYRWSILRILNPGTQSPGASFFTDPASVNIVGALKYNTDGKPLPSGLVTKGKYTLIIKLVKPSPTLLSLLALPFTGAEPLSWPVDSEIVNVPFSGHSQLASAGPYYVASRQVNRSVVIKRNSHYKPVGAPMPPHRAAGFQFQSGVQAQQALLLIKKGQSDWAADGLDPSVWGGLFQQYGTHGRARVSPTSCVIFVAMNTRHSAFGKASTRQGINYGISRKSFVQLDGAHGGAMTDQVLSPTIPGYKNVNIYPNTPSLAKAKKLVKSATGAHIELWHRTSASSILRGQLLESQLRSMGFKNIDQKAIASGFYSQLGRSGTSYDISASPGWCQDFPDPYDYLNKLESGNTLQAAENVNWAFLNVPTVNKWLNQAALLRPPKRFKVYGNLDAKIQKRYAPYAPYEIQNDRWFFSSRIAPQTYSAHPIYTFDLGRLALK